MTLSAALGLAAWSTLALPAAADQATPPPAKAAPSATPVGGTVIKPPMTVDPGIQAKTPAPEHFPTPVIKPAPSPQPPR